MKELRKLSDIWKAIDDKRILSKMNKYEWRQSFEGIQSTIAPSRLRGVRFVHTLRLISSSSLRSRFILLYYKE